MKPVLLLVCLISVTTAQFGGLPNAAKPFSNSASQVAQGVQNAANSVSNQFKSFQSSLGPLAKTAQQIAERSKIFEGSKKFVDEFNKAGQAAYKLALNPLSALTNGEFNKLFNGFNRGGRKTGPSPDSVKSEPPKPQGGLPESVDWTKKGAVTPVTSQYLCAGCWAFAAAGALEGHKYKKTGKLDTISPQHLIDCVYKGEDGCQGGIVDDAFKYAKANGVNPANDYPYENKTGHCRYDQENVVARAKGFAEVPQGNEKHLAAALAAVGPIAVGIDAGRETFQNYKSGVYDDPECSSDPAKANHAVLLVGYGVEDGKKFWLLKNTYGPEWGIDGYFKLAKDSGNRCGVANYAIYPIV